MIDHYFDLNDFKTPIKSFVTDGYDYYGTDGFLSEGRFYLQENKARLHDNYFPMGEEPDDKSFIGIGHSDRLYRNSQDVNVLSITILKSQYGLLFERSVFTYLDLLGSLGGIYEIISLLGYVFVSSTTCTAFYYSILPKLYQIDTLGCQKDHGKALHNYQNDLNISNNNLDISHNMEVIKHEEDKVSVSSHQISITNYNTHRELNPNKEEKFRTSLIERARKNMKNRMVYNYKISDKLYSFC